jgi:hypothetical protein
MKKNNKRRKTMIRVTNEPQFGRGVRAFVVPPVVKKTQLTPELMSCLSDAYFGYFAAQDTDFSDPTVVSTAAIFIDLGEEHSWKWHFVCDRVKKTGKMQVIEAFILDGPAAASTLAKDVPGTFRLLPAPIDVDQKTEELMKKLEETPRRPASDDAAAIGVAVEASMKKSAEYARARKDGTKKATNL